MLSSQGDSGSSKNIKSDTRGNGRGSWGMMLLGMALLTCALLLYFYYESNRPKVVTESGDISNINRTRPEPGAETPRPTPSPTASPSKKPAQKSGARISQYDASSQDEMSENKRSACDLA